MPDPRCAANLDGKPYIPAPAEPVSPERKALERALDALRKIRLNHPCDLHDRIAHFAVEEIKEMLG